MKGSKLYSILEEFDKYEQNKCRKYVASPYFNKSEVLLNLYDLLVKQINKPPKREVTKMAMWRKLHSNKMFDDIRYRKYMSDLLKLVEGYITNEVLDKDEMTKSHLVLKAMGERKLKKLYNSGLKNAQ